MMLEANSSYKEGDGTSWWCHIYSLPAVSALTYKGPRVFSLSLKDPPLFLNLLQAKGAGNLRCDLDSCGIILQGRFARTIWLRPIMVIVMQSCPIQLFRFALCLHWKTFIILINHYSKFTDFFYWTAKLEELLLNVKHLS